MKFISIGTEEIDDIAFQQESDIIDVKEDSNYLGIFNEFDKNTIFEKDTDDLIDAFDTVVSLETIQETLESSNEAMSIHTYKSLVTTVETLSKKYITNKPNFIALEEFGSKNHSKEISLEFLSSIRGIVKSIWDFIINLIEKIIKFFKETIFGFKKKNDSLQDEAETALTNIQKEPEITTDKFFTSVKIQTYLSVNGKVPEAHQLLQTMRDYYERQYSPYSLAFDLLETVASKHLLSALNNVNKDGGGFKEGVDSAQSVICTSNIGKPSHSNIEMPLEPGYALYEAPIVFGDLAIYRPGVTMTGGKLSETSIPVVVNKNAKYLNKPLETTQELPYLSKADRLAIAKAVVNHCQNVNKNLVKQNSNLQALENIRKKVITIRDNNKPDTRSNRRANVMFKVLKVYLKYRKDMLTCILETDKRIGDSFMYYVNKTPGINSN